MNGAIRVTMTPERGQFIEHWTVHDLPMPTDDAGRTLRPTLYSALSTEWNIELLVGVDERIELWRLSPHRLRRIDPVWFARDTPLWGIQEASPTADGFSIRARNGVCYDLPIDAALGGPLGGRELTQRTSRRPTYLEPSGHRDRDGCEYDVFVSYKRSETAVEAAEAVQALRARQVAVWFDADINLGYYETHIKQGISSSSAYLVFLSPGSDDGAENVEISRHGRIGTFKRNQLWERGLISASLDEHDRTRFGAIFLCGGTAPPDTPLTVISPDNHSIEETVDGIVAELNRRRRPPSAGEIV